MIIDETMFSPYYFLDYKEYSSQKVQVTAICTMIFRVLSTRFAGFLIF